MRGLTLIVASGDGERFRAALTLACAQAALGGRARIFCHERAVALLAGGEDADAAALAAAGLPGRAALLSMAIEAGVAITACQTGLALAGLTAGDLPEGIETGGMVDILANLDDDRLDTI